ncbi:hypothetical protein FGO68_gene12466 [Halteria grandinella]|uniref:Uncharacterized protein n=1 Tax=Halteria grandinella TaxID=5974 RepID=A0A8J8SYU0_HALGN|nr:hypothetical protein FGO68_gene12466 [Halteria grandinella]
MPAYLPLISQIAKGSTLLSILPRYGFVGMYFVYEAVYMFLQEFTGFTNLGTRWIYLVYFFATFLAPQAIADFLILVEWLRLSDNERHDNVYITFMTPISLLLIAISVIQYFVYNANGTSYYFNTNYLWADPQNIEASMRKMLAIGLIISNFVTDILFFLQVQSYSFDVKYTSLI